MMMMKQPTRDELARLFEETVQLIVQNLPFLSETIFTTKIVARQILLAILLQFGAVTAQHTYQVLCDLCQILSPRHKLIAQMTAKTKTAQTHDEWKTYAEQLDVILGNDIWRETQDCALYEADRIVARMDELTHLMRRNDVFDLMFTLRGGISRARFGLLHEGLFSKALAGTKLLVENYQTLICQCLDFVCDTPTLPSEDPIPTDARLAFFNETRHSYGRTAMLLSGGAALGFYHVGVIKVLIEQGLMPRVIGGASAGSIVAAMIGTRTDKECEDLFRVEGTDAPGHSGIIVTNFFRPISSSRSTRQSSYSARLKPHHNKNLNDEMKEVIDNSAGAFRQPKLMWQGLAPQGLRKFTSFLWDVVTGNRRPNEVLLQDSAHFKKCLRLNIGNFTFQEAFDRTGRILNITVSPQNRSDPPRLLNYLTSPHVLVWSAAAASSSLPGVFKSCKLLVKDSDGTERYESTSGLRFQDGSMENDLPMEQLAEMFNVNHFIISQVNPHAYMFASFALSRSVWNSYLLTFANGILTFVKNQVKAWAKNMIELISGHRIAPIWDTRRGFFSQFFIQEYEGRDSDITINPWNSHRSLFSAFMHLVYNPSDEEFSEWIKAGERETWKCIPAIKSHCAVEMVLDRCVQRLRRRVLDETWEMTHQNNVIQTANNNRMSSQQQRDSIMGNRLPSFFQSPSLVNMGGLGIADTFTHYEEVEAAGSNNGRHHHHARPIMTHNNTSNNNMNRSNSEVSGVFMDADESSVDAAQHPMTLERTKSGGSISNNSGGYIKTSHMADFYYRKNKSHDNLSNEKFFEPLPDDSVHNNNHGISSISRSPGKLLGSNMVSLEGAAPS